MWLLGVLALWLVLMPAVMKGRWRVDVLRVQYLYSFAHLLAVVDVVRHRARAWVATGARTTTPTAVTVLRMTKAFVLVTVMGAWVGIGLGVWRYGMDDFWAMAALAVLASYIEVPLLFVGVGRRR